MGALRDRMIRDMTVRGFSSRTHEAYIQQVVGLAKYYRRPPDQLSVDEVQTYLAMLFTERKRSWSTCAQAAHAFRFLYHVTLGRPRTEFRVPAPKQPQKLPEILSRQEVWRLLEACETPRDRLLLATTYAAGLRASEVVALKVSDIDADRMTVRVEPGKGGTAASRRTTRTRARRLGHLMSRAHDDSKRAAGGRHPAATPFLCALIDVGPRRPRRPCRHEARRARSRRRPAVLPRDRPLRDFTVPPLAPPPSR